MGPPPQSSAATTAMSPAPQESWRPRPGKLIGDVIVEQGFAPREAVEAAAVAGREEGKQLGQVLIDRAHITPEQLGQAVALRFGLEYVEILNHQVDPVAVSMSTARSRAGSRCCRSASPTRASCASRWRTRPTSWRSTTWR